jgi:N-acyl-L-homoserine lactone synthetase
VRSGKRVPPVTVGSRCSESSAPCFPCGWPGPSRTSGSQDAAGAPPGSQTWWEGDYRIKTQLTAAERASMYRLRTRVFSHELRWVAERADGFERDEFDLQCSHLAVIDPQGEVVATARVSFSTQPWMLDRPFWNLRPPSGELCRGRHVGEISRLAIDAGVRSVRLRCGRTMADLLYKSLFNFCLLHDLRVNYAVVSAAMWRHMRMRGLAGALLGSFHAMEDGVKAGLVLVDWNGFIATNRRMRPELLKWYLDWESVSHVP